MTVFAQTEMVFVPLWVFLVLGDAPKAATVVGGAIIFAAVVGKAILDTSPRRGAARPRVLGKRARKCRCARTSDVIDGPGGQIELVNLTKTYDRAPVLKGINLTIQRGEFFSLLGPSGCGKTTTLRLIGGFESADSGEVRIDGVDMADVPPENRPVNTVFQSYALFPHLSVADNVGFGLRFQKASKAETTTACRRGTGVGAARRVSASARRISCRAASNSASRLPGRSCCGRRCCCSTNRSALSTPSCARRCRSSCVPCTKTSGITFVYVTHDQEEALTMSDRLAVMNDGEIEQIGTPKETYEEPASAYVADFLGVANLLPATVTRPGRVVVNGSEHAADTLGVIGDCTVVIRPERVLLSPLGTGQSKPCPRSSSNASTSARSPRCCCASASTSCRRWSPTTARRCVAPRARPSTPTSPRTRSECSALSSKRSGRLEPTRGEVAELGVFAATLAAAHPSHDQCRQCDCGECERPA